MTTLEINGETNSSSYTATKQSLTESSGGFFLFLTSNLDHNLLFSLQQ